ncbi:hypothetical protein OXIME_000991 [Oxyplasma meridianum]|uniref:Alpha/beta hydrolase n=1 Tax=Oxyplasma meridianum TaxID=3073602 RepID=A0AAX4NG02_9ARCH
MSEPELKKDDCGFKVMGNLDKEKVVFLITPEIYIEQFQRIRFKDKVGEWGYDAVFCAVSNEETQRIRTMEFDDLNMVLGKIYSEMTLFNKSPEITLIALDELAVISLMIYLKNYNISKIILLNPVFFPEIAVKLSKVEIPTFILYSGNSKTPSALSSRKYHDLIAGSSLHNMAGTSREDMLARKTQFFSHLKTFLGDDQEGT